MSTICALPENWISFVPSVSSVVKGFSCPELASFPAIHLESLVHKFRVPHFSRGLCARSGDSSHDHKEPS